MDNPLIPRYALHGEALAPEQMRQRQAMAANAQAGLARLQESAARQQLAAATQNQVEARRELATAERAVSMSDTAELTATIRTYLEMKKAV